MRRNKKINKQIYDMIQGDECQGKKAGKENGSYKVVSVFSGMVRKGLTEKVIFEASEQEPCWEHHSRQREQ